MTYKEAYKQIVDWLHREYESCQYNLKEIDSELKGEGVPKRNTARLLIKTNAWADQINETITEMEDLEEEIEDNEQNAAIKFCHEHKLLMIPVDLYHTLNVTYNAYMNNMTYEEAEKRLLNEVKE